MFKEANLRCKINGFDIYQIIANRKSALRSEEFKTIVINIKKTLNPNLVKTVLVVDKLQHILNVTNKKSTYIRQTYQKKFLLKNTATIKKFRKKAKEQISNI